MLSCCCLIFSSFIKGKQNASTYSKQHSCGKKQRKHRKQQIQGRNSHASYSPSHQYGISKNIDRIHQRCSDGRDQKLKKYRVSLHKSRCFSFIISSLLPMPKQRPTIIGFFRIFVKQTIFPLVFPSKNGIMVSLGGEEVRP